MSPTVDDLSTRTIRRSDRSGLARFHESLSRETIRRRFFNLHAHLSDDELRRFTDVDHDRRDALVVVTPAGEIVAVGRYELSPDRSAAEVAFVVSDRWQGHGLGSVLLSQVAAGAHSHGAASLVADTLSTNRPMLDVFRRAGWPMTSSVEAGVTRVTLDIRDGVPMADDGTIDSGPAIQTGR